MELNIESICMEFKMELFTFGGWVLQEKYTLGWNHKWRKDITKYGANKGREIRIECQKTEIFELSKLINKYDHIKEKNRMEICLKAWSLISSYNCSSSVLMATAIIYHVISNVINASASLVTYHLLSSISDWFFCCYLEAVSCMFAAFAAGQYV